jgi:hypothetical protein
MKNELRQNKKSANIDSSSMMESLGLKCQRMVFNISLGEFCAAMNRRDHGVIGATP